MSVSLGLLLGFFYGVVSFVVAAVALRLRIKAFMALYFGGMIVRMVLTLGAVVLVITMLEVNETLFVGALMGTLALCIALEILWLIRRRRPQLA